MVRGPFNYLLVGEWIDEYWSQQGHNSLQLNLSNNVNWKAVKFKTEINDFKV